ncbi:SMP-30/gluconolactonase/LRE family protein [Terrabacter sp. GCM10028922]|uniref:SMP-30/gluconolactonase/LRE family protein n=1 Tax=Terrabacter sp. GCM10028922 TaxID=3273428 RepID=UPI00360FFE47
MSPRRPRPRSRAQRALAVLAAPALVVALSGASAVFPHVIDLPVDFAPEGVAVVDHTFYAGSLVDGDIYRGDLRDRSVEKFVDVEQRQAGGLKADVRHGLLFVAGGFNGTAYVYDLATGDDVAQFSLGTPGASLVNDVVVTRDAAWFTETFAPRLYRVPIHEDGSLGAPVTLDVTGPATGPAGFGLNGIDATPDGRTLIVNHTERGALYTVDPTSGESAQIVLTSGSLAPGTPDGILLAGHDLWVVENFANRVSRVSLSPDWTSGAVTQVVTDPAFQVPTTIAKSGNRYAVVNGKFDLGFPKPIGPGAPPGTPFELVQFVP